MKNDINNQLVKACIDGNLAEVNRLIKDGANPNANDDGYTALRAAAGEGYVEIVKILLSVWANPNAVDNDGKTVFYFANEGWSNSETQEKAFEYSKVVAMLRAAGAKE